MSEPGAVKEQELVSDGEAIGIGDVSKDTEKGDRPLTEVWSSRTAFYFAAVGAAVGFGNVWRFPALSVEYGGGAFFIPYFMAFFLIGIPILVLELALGQFWQTGDVGVFSHFNPRLAGIGVASVSCGFMLVTYYSILIAWVANAFFDSFTDSAPWTDDDVNGDIAITYFVDEIIGAGTLSDGNRATRLVGANVGYSALVWFTVFVCLAFGTRVTGQITYFTMGLPIVVLFVFLIRALTLEGASDGIEVYIGKWDVSVLKDQGDVWSLATTQIFFSIGITFGIMTAFGSHCKRDEPAFVNSVVIASANSLFSIISGFAVFASLGHLAYLEGKSVEELSYGGFSLVFGTWPVVLGTLPGGIHWVRLLFLDLFMLGIDSAFALIEAVLTVITDTERFQRTPKWQVAGVVSSIGFLLSLIYASDAGLNWLDVIDYYINFVMTLVGLFETVGAGWVYGIEDQFESLGHYAVYSWMFLANFLPVIFACSLWYGLDDNAVWAGFVGLIVSCFCGTAATTFFLKKKMDEEPGRWTWSSIWWELAFSNIFKLKNLIEPVVQPIPAVWALLIKGLIPHLLIVLFVNAAATEEDNGDSKFGNYGGYDTKPYQVLGILTSVFALFLFLLGFLFPQIYAPLATSAREKASAVEEADRVSDEMAGKVDDAVEATGRVDESERVQEFEA